MRAAESCAVMLAKAALLEIPGVKTACAVVVNKVAASPSNAALPKKRRKVRALVQSLRRVS